MQQKTIKVITDDKLETALTNTSATIMQLTLTLMVLAAFAMAVVGTPDKALLLTDELMAVPIVGRMPTLVALSIGPLLLVFVRVYMQFYINHWRRLDRERAERALVRPAELSPMRDGLLRTGTVIIRYTLVPFAMAAITWKSLGTPGTLSFALICATVFVTILHLLQDLPPKWWLWAPAFGMASLGVAAMTEPGQKFLPEAWAAKLPAPQEVRRKLNLRYADLSDRVLEGRDLQGADMRKAKLMESDLSPREFEDEGRESIPTNLSGANLSSADLTDANLRWASLTDANLFSADLIAANLFSADLTDANLPRATLTGATLSRANLTGANLVFADLTDANLLGATLTDATLYRATLIGADLRYATLSGAGLNGADLRRAKGLNCEQLTKAGNWEMTYRDPELACGADIPEPPAEDE